MATVTGASLVAGIESSTGVTLNAVLKASLTAKLQQMIDKGTYSATSAAVAIQAFSSQIKTVVDANGGTAAFVNNVTAVKTAVENDTTIPTFGSTTPTNPTAFPLTTGADTFIGTANNDTVTGTTATLNGNDTIIDTTTTDNDVLKLTATSAVVVPAGGIVRGIEKLEVTWDSFSDAAVTASNFVGLKELVVTTSKLGNLGNLTVTSGGAATVTAGEGMSGKLTVNGVTTGVVNAGSATEVVAAAASTTGADDTVTVNAGAATTTITVGSGSGSAFDAATVTAGAATTTITVSADKTATVTAGAATKNITTTSAAATIDATAAVKDAVVTVNGSGAADVATITLGNDATVTSNLAGTEKLTLDVAAGKTVTLTGISGAETLEVKGAGDVTLKATAANLTTDTVTKSNTGNLTVQITDNVSNAIDLSKVAADLYKMTVATSSGAATAVSGKVFEVAAANASGSLALTASGSGAADTLTAKLTSAAYAGVTGAAGLETLVIEAAAAQASGAATAVDLTINNVATNSGSTGTIELKGTNDVWIKAATATTFDASALNGTLQLGAGSGATALTGVSVNGAQGVNDIGFANVSGSTVAFVGQSANDKLAINGVASGGQATAILGAGNDTLTLTASGSAGVLGTLSVQAGAGDDVVVLDAGSGSGSVAFSGGTIALEFGDGNDTLRLTASGSAGASLDNAKSLVLTGLETIELATASGGAFNIGAAAVTGKTLRVVSDGASGNATLNINGSALADTIDISKFTATATDTVVGAKLVVDGGSGADTIILGTTAFATVKLASGAADADTITGFVVGANKDVLDSALVNVSGGITVSGGVATTAASGALAALTKDTTGAASGGTDLANQVFIFNGTKEELAAKIVDASGNGALYLVSGSNALALIGNAADGVQTFSVYDIAGASGTDTITLVGTVTVNDGDALVTANFA